MKIYEPFDIYNENKVRTGNIKIRNKDVIEANEYALITKAVIINSNKQILIGKRSKLKNSNPGLWEINGGLCIAGEDSLQGIHREIAEELGIDLSKYNEILYKEVKTSEAFLDFYLYNIDIDILNLKFNDNEVEEAKWVYID